jgi:predicted ATP-grasp superfamily ATP-dependent carboligase
MDRPRLLVILGMNLTALAVARSARRWRVEPWVVDVEPGPAAHSRIARCMLDRSRSRAALLQKIIAEVADRRAWLVSTSDAWNHELLAHREAVDRAFANVLQPSNDALATCLSKTRFAAWCEANDVPAPRQYRYDPETSQVIGNIGFPVFVRPDETQHGRPRPGIAKARTATTPSELSACLARFREDGLVPSISESLLGRELQQISVGVAIDGDCATAMVARKVRPLAQACRVGTLVETIDDDEAESLAVATMRKLGYVGIGEVEILEDTTTGKMYVIEINARPWIQFALAEAAGRDLLGFFLTERRDTHRERQRKRVWLDFSTDVWNCFNRDDGLVHRQQISMAEYLRSLLRADVYARWTLRDPWPFLAETFALGSAVLRTLRRRPLSSKPC